MAGDKDDVSVEMENLLPKDAKNEPKQGSPKVNGRPPTSPSTDSMHREQFVLAVKAGNVDDVYKCLYESQLSDDKILQLVETFDKHQMTVLHIASERGYGDVVQVILGGLKEQAVNKLVMVPNGSGHTMLHLAARAGQVDVIKVLQKHVKDPTWKELILVQDGDTNSALHLACAEGQTETVRLLLETLKNELLVELLMIQNSNEDTALHSACAPGYINIVKLLIGRLDHHKLMNLYEITNSEKRTALQKACEEGNAETVQVLLEKLNDDGTRQVMMMRDSKEMTALHVACDNGVTSVVKILLEKLKIEVVNELILLQEANGMSALHLGCDYGHSCVIKALFERLSDEMAEKFVMIQDNRKMTALHITCELGRSAILEVFFEKLKPAVLDNLILVKDDSKDTILVKACRNGETDVVKKLFKQLKSGIIEKLVMATDLTNANALDVAYACKQFDIITEMLKANHHFCPKVKKNVILEACQRGASKSVLDILEAVHDYTQHHKTGNLMHGFLTTQDEDGRMVLHIACNRGDKNVVKGVLRLAKSKTVVGELLCHSDKTNRTPLHESCIQGDSFIVQMLLDAADKVGCVEEMLCNTPDKNALYEAFERKDYNNVKLILDQAKFSECTERLLSLTNDDGQTLIHRSCLYKYNSLKCLEAVVKAARHDRMGFFAELINRKDDSNKTFLFYSKESRIDHLRYLIVKFNGEECENREAIVRDLLMHKDKDDEHGKTAVQYAKECEKTYLLARLLEPLQENVKDLKKPSDFLLLDNAEIQANYEENKETSLLNVVSETESLEFIEDSYITAYLQCCWRSYGCYFYFTNLFLYVVLLISLTAFICGHQIQFAHVNGTTIYHDVTLISKLPALTTTCQYLLVIFSILTLINEVLQVIAKRSHYWSTLENKTDLAVCLGSIVMSIASLITGYNYWQHQLGALTMCFAWINAAWMMTKIPTFQHKNLRKLSLMFVMLFRAIKGVCIFVPIFAVFVVTFSVVFSSLFQSQSSFSQVGYAVMKTIAMTIGEVDFNAIFVPDDVADTPPFYLLSCVLFVVFIGIMTISAMNLLVGMAVGDIVELRTQSEILAFKTTFDFTLESQATLALFTKIKNRTQKPRADDQINLCNSSNTKVNV